HGGEADEGEAPNHQAGVTPESARAGQRRGRMAETGRGRLLPLSRRAGEPRGAGTIPRPSLPTVVASSAPPQPKATARLGSLAPGLHPLDSSTPCPAPLP